MIFRPLAAPRRLPDHAARQRARELVRAHGTDTLSFFKLRADKHYFFSEDQRAFVGYRIENGVLLLSGDPVGPEDAIRRAARAAGQFAEAAGSSSAPSAPASACARCMSGSGLHTLYLGDEAIVDLTKFSLRAARSARSASR